MDNERLLIQQAAASSRALSSCPFSNLGPFIPEIKQLSMDFDRLADAITTHPSEDGVSASSQNNDEAPSLSRRRNQVNRLISSLMGMIPEVESAAFISPHLSELSREQPRREVHIQTILFTQKRRLSGSGGAQERLMLVCACLSLAKDFGTFERRNGWIPKSDQLATRIIRNQDPDVQRIGKRVSNYIAAMGSTIDGSSTDQPKLDAALRFGVKLEVWDAAAAAEGLGSGLSLLMGFECVHFSRLPYAAFGDLRQEIVDNVSLKQRLCAFSELTSAWWYSYLDNYHRQFGTYTT